MTVISILKNTVGTADEPPDQGKEYIKMANSLGTSVTTKKLEMKPVPLLVVMISFEPGGDDGRQICSTTKEYWYEQFFGDNGLTLKNYYKEMSGGKFYFSPVDVNGSDVKGVVHVTLHCKHPDLLQQENPDKRTGAALYVVAEALKACEPYVDFAALDKDGDGFLSADELHYVLVHAGFDYSGGKETTPELRYGVFANSGRLPDEEDAQRRLHIVVAARTARTRTDQVGNVVRIDRIGGLLHAQITHLLVLAVRIVNRGSAVVNPDLAARDAVDPVGRIGAVAEEYATVGVVGDDLAVIGAAAERVGRMVGQTEQTAAAGAARRDCRC
jgi:hypothetical protein